LIRLVLGVIAGYLLTTALALLGHFLFAGEVNLRFLDLALAFPYGFAGGWVAGSVARQRAVEAGLLIGLGIIALGIFSVAQDSSDLLWYWIALIASLTAGAVYGSFRKFASVQKNAPRKKKKAAK
jgi:hypothetical protein